LPGNPVVAALRSVGTWRNAGRHVYAYFNIESPATGSQDTGHRRDGAGQRQ